MTPKLTAAQRAALPTVLAKGAEAYGFIGDVWTTARVAAVIRREFGVRHHPAHVSRILRAIGWTVQKPVKRSTKRDEAAITARSRLMRCMFAGRCSSRVRPAYRLSATAYTARAPVHLHEHLPDRCTNL